MRFTTFRSAALGLRPLLCAAGAAATAAGVYYMIKKRGDGQRRAEPADTAVLQDCLEHAESLMNTDPGYEVEEVTVTPAEPEDSLTDAEEKEQRTQEDSERSSLEDRVMELEKLLCEAYIECEIKTKDSLSEIKKMYKQAMESNADLEKELSNLIFQVQKLEEELAVTRTNYEKQKKEYDIGQGIISFLKIKSETQLTAFQHKIKTLKEALSITEKEKNDTRRINVALQRENDELITSVRTQEELAENLMVQITQTQIQCDEMTRERNEIRQEHEELKYKWNSCNKTIMEDYREQTLAYSNLQLKYKRMKELCRKLLQESELKRNENFIRTQSDPINECPADCEKSLMDNPDDTVEKYEQATKSDARTNDEKTDLPSQIHKLGGRVQQLEEMLYEADMSVRNEGSSPEAEKNPKNPAMEPSAHLENENLDLVEKVNLLQISVQQLEEAAFNIGRKFDVIRMETLGEQMAHAVQAIHCSAMIETLKKCDKLLSDVA